VRPPLYGSITSAAAHWIISSRDDCPNAYGNYHSRGGRYLVRSFDRVAPTSFYPDLSGKMPPKTAKARPGPLYERLGILDMPMRGTIEVAQFVTSERDGNRCAWTSPNRVRHYGGPPALVAQIIDENTALSLGFGKFRRKTFGVFARDRLGERQSKAGSNLASRLLTLRSRPPSVGLSSRLPAGWYCPLLHLARHGTFPRRGRADHRRF
jgi:hypothetical protein